MNYSGMLQVQAGSTVTELKPCQVDCHHYGSGLGNLADDPFHCDMYYVCFGWNDWSKISFSCPEGEKFDTTTKTCMKEGYTCSDPCQKCSYECNNPVMGQAALFYNCSVFMECSGNSGTVAACPPDSPYFDGNVCQDDFSKCCSCKPECSKNDAQNHLMIPDYSNCTNFYLCVASGIPDETSHGHCPSGNFDPNLGSCSNSAPCNTLCTNGPPVDSCVDEWVCEKKGYFPRCPEKCDPDYFECSRDDIGNKGHLRTCSHDQVMDPIAMMCVPPENCSM